MEKNLNNNDENKVSEGIFEWSGVPKIEELLNMLCDLSIKYEIVKRKLKEKNEEIETIKGFLNRTTFTKEITKQVCEKIRGAFSRIYRECNSQRQMWDKFFNELDQIERG